VDIRFLQPLWLALLIALPLLWFVSRRPENRVQTILRTTLAALLVFALARPVWLTSNDRTYWVFVVDRSASVPQEQQRKAEATLTRLRAQLPKGDPVSVIGIGADSRADSTVAGQSSSSLGTALRAAAARIPQGSRGVVTLLSDGESTDRDWGLTAQTFSVRGIAVHTIQVDARKRDLYPSNLQTEPHVRVGQTVRAVVDVVGEANDFSVRLMGADGELGRAGPLMSKGRVSVPIEFEARKPGFFKVTAHVLAGSTADSDPGNNSLTHVFAVQDALKLLYVGDRQRGGAARLRQLLGRGFDVADSAGQPLDEKFPLSGYDLVLIDDKPANALPVAFQQNLIAAVRNRGVGLLVAGGEASFGAGGYYNTLISHALPVEISQREEKRDPSVSLAIVIDTSGSMAGPPLELAKQVAQLTIRRLAADDLIGIVEFYGAKHWAVPLQSADNRTQIDRAIGRMQAAGGTELYPGIEEAYYGLKNVHTRHKHILVITDAGVEDADFESMVRRISKDGINVSSVLVGDGRYDEVMFNLATWGKGRYYAVADRFALVELILKEMSTRQLPSYRTGEFPLVSRGGPGWWGNIDRTALPPLGAYVGLDARPRSEVLIETEGHAHPVLVSWHYGLGRVTTLMTEPLGAGTRPWQAWPDYGPMLGRFITRTAAEEEAMNYELLRNGTSLKVLARRDSEDSRLRPAAMLVEGRKPLQFMERAPGFFEANLPVSQTDELRIVAGIEGSPLPLHTRLVSAASDFVLAERQVDPDHALDLQRLSRATGGQLLGADAAMPKNASNVRSLSAPALWPWCALLALLLYLAEIVHRRRVGP